MGQKQCEKCGDSVDEAKAFCPGCGNAFVPEEIRQNASEFDKLDNTVQLGQTMYNQMLSDMGLNISKAPDTPAPPKRVEVVLTPAAPAAQPVAATQAPKPPANVPAVETPKKGYVKWIVIGAVIVVLGLLFLSAAGVILYIYWPRIT